MSRAPVPPVAKPAPNFAGRSGRVPVRRRGPRSGATAFQDLLDAAPREPAPAPLRDVPVLGPAAVEALARERNRAGPAPRCPYPAPKPAPLVRRDA